MEVQRTDSGSGESFATYRPSMLDAAAWERLGPDAIALVQRLGCSETTAPAVMSRFVVFLADLVSVRPEAPVAELLTRQQVEGHLERARASGVPDSTLQNRQGTLNALLRVVAGQPQSRAQRGPEPRLTPHSTEELTALLDVAASDASKDARCLVKVLVCVLAGHPLPVRGRTVVAELADAPPSVRQAAGLPDSVEVSHGDVDRALEWAKRHGTAVDRRRLALTRLVALAWTRSALEVLLLPGVGRDSLTAVVNAMGSVPADVVRVQVR